MARMYSSGKGQSISMKPFASQGPTYLDITVGEVENIIVTMFKKGNPPSQIGLFLRDHHGIGNLRSLIGCGIVEFLKNKNLYDKLPEDLDALINKTLVLRAHITLNPKDSDAKFRLRNTSSKMFRLCRYYKSKGAIPMNFKPRRD